MEIRTARSTPPLGEWTRGGDKIHYKYTASRRVDSRGAYKNRGGGDPQQTNTSSSGGGAGSSDKETFKPEFKILDGKTTPSVSSLSGKKSSEEG